MCITCIACLVRNDEIKMFNHYLSMLGLKLNHFSSRKPRYTSMSYILKYGKEIIFIRWLKLGRLFTEEYEEVNPSRVAYCIVGVNKRLMNKWIFTALQNWNDFNIENVSTLGIVMSKILQWWIYKCMLFQYKPLRNVENLKAFKSQLYVVNEINVNKCEY